MEIGLVGPGKMGGNMRERLRRAGHTVTGYDMNAEVRDVDGRRFGRVLDVRLDGGPEVQARHSEQVLEVTGLLVGRGRPGGLLGYDRQGEQGPWLVNKAVRWLHRDSGMVDADRIVGIDWGHGRVVVRGGLDPLEPAAEPARPLRDR